VQTREATYSRLSTRSDDRTVTAGTLRACPRAHSQAIEKRVLVGVLEVQCRSTTGALPSATTPTPTLQITSGSPRRISTSGDRHGSGRDCEFGDFGPCCSHDPENWCRRNHSDTLARLICRHDATETVQTEPLQRTSRAPDQDFAKTRVSEDRHRTGLHAPNPPLPHWNGGSSPRERTLRDQVGDVLVVMKVAYGRFEPGGWHFPDAVALSELEPRPRTAQSVTLPHAPGTTGSRPVDSRKHRTVEKDIGPAFSTTRVWSVISGTGIRAGLPGIGWRGDRVTARALPIAGGGV
jgi:hypothetical protein